MSRSIGKKLRFEIFARDNFTCRYCGRQSDEVTLVIDHIHPVCQGGDNSPENLATSCFDCNAGKAGNVIQQHAPNDMDRLRMAQELQEQKDAYARVLELKNIREERFQLLVNFWCDCSGEKSVNTPTIKTVFSYVLQHGEELVYKWIELACHFCDTDRERGKYVSGCRRKHISSLGDIE